MPGYTSLVYLVALIISNDLTLSLHSRRLLPKPIMMASSLVTSPPSFRCIATKGISQLASSVGSGELDDPTSSTFGRQDYWNSLYGKEANFSWYAGWEDLEPFLDDFMKSKDDHILVPGVGNDATIVGMYDAGYSYLTAMDYAPEGIERCRDMLGPERLLHGTPADIRETGVDLVVADARKLQAVFDNDSFDAILEKGTLDAIFLSGGKDKSKCHQYLEMSIEELSRTVKHGGVWISVTAVAVDQIQDCFLSDQYKDHWDPIVLKDDFYTTEDGYTSNNIDGSFLVFKKR